MRWRELDEGSATPELDWTTTELRNSLRSIEWDLEDLEDTINILLRVLINRILPSSVNRETYRSLYSKSKARGR